MFGIQSYLGPLTLSKRRGWDLQFPLSLLVYWQSYCRIWFSTVKAKLNLGSLMLWLCLHTLKLSRALAGTYSLILLKRYQIHLALQKVLFLFVSLYPDIVNVIQNNWIITKSFYLAIQICKHLVVCNKE
jgi:hypothetical protein